MSLGQERRALIDDDRVLCVCVGVLKLPRRVRSIQSCLLSKFQFVAPTFHVGCSLAFRRERKRTIQSNLVRIMSTILKVHAREILDSRGNPTVEVEVTTSNGTFRSAVPSGASTGIYEACELRDGDKARYLGKGVQHAVRNVIELIGPAIVGKDVTDQAHVDKTMRDLDGTKNKGRLGANAILGVSMAVSKAAAVSAGLVHCSSVREYRASDPCPMLQCH